MKLSSIKSIVSTSQTMSMMNPPMTRMRKMTESTLSIAR